MQKKNNGLIKSKKTLYFCFSYSGAFTLDRLQLWWQTCPRTVASLLPGDSRRSNFFVVLRPEIFLIKLILLESKNFYEGRKYQEFSFKL